MPNSSLEPLYQSASSASPTGVSCRTSEDVPSQAVLRNSNRTKSKVGTPSPTSKQTEPPPPSYDEVVSVSSADSSPHSERSRTSAASDYEYYSTIESGMDSHVYEEIPASHVSAFLFTYFNYLNRALTYLIFLCNISSLLSACLNVYASRCAKNMAISTFPP